MPKKRSGRQRKAAEEAARRQRRRREAEVAFNDEHARLVAERHADPRFVHRVRTDEGVAITWATGTPADRELRAGMEAQREAFRTKFGRDPDPDDPIFFDPDADEPRPLTDAQWEAGFEDMAAVAAAAGLDPAYVRAWQEVGYIVTEDNRHMFSAAEVRAYLDAVARHADDDPDEGLDVDDGEFCDDLDEDDWDDDADVEGLDLDELGPAEALAVTADGLEFLVAGIVRDQDPAVAVAAVDELAADEQAGELAIGVAFAVLTGWLVGARDHGIDAGAAIGWAEERLGGDTAAAVRELGGLVGHPLAPDVTLAEVGDRLGPLMIPALVWLAAAVTATAGAGDAHWLRRFDLDPGGSAPQ